MHWLELWCIQCLHLCETGTNLAFGPLTRPSRVQIWKASSGGRARPPSIKLLTGNWVFIRLAVRGWCSVFIWRNYRGGSVQLLQGFWHRHWLRCPSRVPVERPTFPTLFFFIRDLAGSTLVTITLQIVHVPDVIVCLSGCDSGGMQSGESTALIWQISGFLMPPRKKKKRVQKWVRVHRAPEDEMWRKSFLKAAWHVPALTCKTHYAESKWVKEWGKKGASRRWAPTRSGKREVMFELKGLNIFSYSMGSFSLKSKGAKPRVRLKMQSCFYLTRIFIISFFGTKWCSRLLLTIWDVGWDWLSQLEMNGIASESHFRWGRSNLVEMGVEWGYSVKPLFVVGTKNGRCVSASVLGFLKVDISNVSTMYICNLWVLNWTSWHA